MYAWIGMMWMIETCPRIETLRSTKYTGGTAYTRKKFPHFQT